MTRSQASHARRCLSSGEAVAFAARARSTCSSATLSAVRWTISSTALPSTPAAIVCSDGGGGISILYSSEVANFRLLDAFERLVFPTA
eukprot:scaffold30631_cov75-Phaeocystis_antarctica.AAC.1